MALNQTPVISMYVGGAPVQVNVDVFTGVNGDQMDPSAALSLPNPNGFSSVATIALHPSDPRAVIVTPAASGNGGTAGLLVNEVGGATNPLQVNVSVTVQPMVKQVVFKSSGPVV